MARMFDYFSAHQQKSVRSEVHKLSLIASDGAAENP
jgi:hypothetical protein